MNEQGEKPVSEKKLDDMPVFGLSDEGGPPIQAAQPKARLPVKGMVAGVAVLGVVAVALVFGVRWYLGRSDASLVSEGRVRGELITVGPALSGKIDMIAVQEGDRIEKGQTAARLGTAEFQAEVDKANAKVLALRSESDDVTAALTVARAKAGKTVPQTEARLKEAREWFETARAGEQNAMIRTPDRRYVTYQAGPGYVHDTIAARRDREYFRAEQQRARKEIAACQAELKAAATDAAALKTLEEKSEALNGKISEAEGELGTARGKLAAAAIISPVSGMVVKVRGKAGDAVEGGQPVVTIWNPDRMWVEAWLGNADSERIRPGQPVSLRTESFPQENFAGKVTGLGNSFTGEKGDLPDSRARGTDEKPGQGIPVKISVDDPQRLLRPEMTMTVKFVVGAGSDAPSGRWGGG